MVVIVLNGFLREGTAKGALFKMGFRESGVEKCLLKLKRDGDVTSPSPPHLVAVSV